MRELKKKCFHSLVKFIYLQYFMLSSWWCKALCGVCCIITGCYFCCCCLCCCNCCCGRCAPKIEEDDIPDAENLAQELEEDESAKKDGPTVTQPRSRNSPGGDNSPKTANGNSSSGSAIPLGPGPTSSSPTTSQPISLGPPPGYSSSPTRSPPSASETSELNTSSPKHYNSTSTR